MHLSHVNPNLIQPYIKNLIPILENDLNMQKKYGIEGANVGVVANYLQMLKNAQ